MISTDNHVGFLEKDPIRGGDSFLAFEEVLTRAKEQKVRLAVSRRDGTSSVAWCGAERRCGVVW